ncbi:RNA-directed DNA polymerase, eukaryota [Tanacetum coccineum]
MTSISHMDVKFLWGNSNYDYVCSESLGNSGGILCIWEASIFKKINTTVSDNFIAIYGTWLPTNSKILFIAIYAPQQTSCKRKLWDYISNIVGRWNGESIIMGDFNEVRSSEERGITMRVVSWFRFDQSARKKFATSSFRSGYFVSPMFFVAYADGGSLDPHDWTNRFPRVACLGFFPIHSPL